jgi:predicted Zn-ribbon and HTH transcriptional regulator
VLLALAATGILLLGVRSRWRVDEVAYSTPTARRWVSTYRGSLQVVSLGYWPEAMPPSYATFDLASAPASPWEDGGVVVAKKAGWGPFRHVDGTLAQRLWTRPRPYQSFHTPLWSVALLVGLLPLVSGARWAGRRLRTRTRRRQGRCLACGYDLRGNASPERCPECGEPTPTTPADGTARRQGPRAVVGMLLAGLTAVSLGGRTAQAGTVTRLGAPAWAQAERAAPNRAVRDSARAVRTEEDVASLRVFLEHPSADFSGVGRSRRVTYPLRRTAYVVLRNWGVPTPMPVINDPIDSQGPLSVLAPGAAGVLLVTFACSLLPRPPRRLGVSDRALPAALKRGGLTALALAALLLVTLALRGRTHADEVTFTARGSRHWVSSCDGKLEWTTIRGWPATPYEPAEPSFASFALGGPLDVRWRQGPQNVTGEQTRLGMTQVDGTTPDFGHVQRAYRRVGMRCRTLAIAAGALPLVFLGMAAGRSLRRRFRVTVGRCKGCGYDLRGTAGRCPECGEWRGPIRGRRVPPPPAASPKPAAMACALPAPSGVTSAAGAGLRSTS